MKHQICKTASRWNSKQMKQQVDEVSWRRFFILKFWSLIFFPIWVIMKQGRIILPLTLSDEKNWDQSYKIFSRRSFSFCVIS